MKQTAVTNIRDWIRTNGEMSEEGKFITYSCTDLEKVIKQAKEIEKEQIIDAHIKGHKAPSSTLKNLDAEQYYNETFNK